MNLAFPVFISPIVWNMCENLHYESVYFKELHNDQEYYWPTIYWAGAAVVSTITSFIEDKTKYVLVTRRAFCGHFCLLVPGYNLNFRFLRTWSIYFFVFVVFVCTGILMDKMPAKSLRSVSMTESQTALICNLKFAKINFPRVRKRSRMEKFGPFPYTEKFFFFH